MTNRPPGKRSMPSRPGTVCRANAGRVGATSSYGFSLGPVDRGSSGSLSSRADAGPGERLDALEVLDAGAAIGGGAGSQRPFAARSLKAAAPVANTAPVTAATKTTIATE